MKVKPKFLRGVSKNDLHLCVTLGFASSFLLFGYEFVRTSSNAIFKSHYSPSNLPVVMALSPVALLALMVVYEKLLARLGPRKTLFYTTLFSSLVLGFGYLAIINGIIIASAVIFIFKSAYIVLIIEQYWSFINSTLEEKSAKKLTGSILGISTIGAVAGGLTVKALAIPLGAPTMILIAAFFLLPCALISDFAFKRHGSRVKQEHAHEDKDDSKNRFGLKEFKRFPSLKYLLGIVLLTQCLAAVLQISFQEVVHQVYPDPDEQTAFLGGFFASLNAVAVFLQFIGAPLLLKFFSPFAIQAIIPVVHIFTCAALSLSPTLAVASVAYITFKSLDYSLFRVSKEILYMPMSFDARYRAKELIDVFGYRFGKGAFSLAVTVVQRLGVQMSSYFSPIAFVITLIWFATVVPLKKAHKVSSQEPLSEKQ